jgi:predicted ArsR family transcriptional regulator
MVTRWDERFFASTRGQVVTLLRRGGSTVDELAGALELTDNAVRAHLTALERDGLIRQGELRRTGGKPSFTYELTPEAERLFPKAYGLLLSQILDVLEDRIPPEELGDMLREVGHRMAAGQPAPVGDLRSRVDRAQALLSSLGGLSDVEEVEGGFLIVGCSCPISAAVEGTADACLMAETLLSDVTGVPVRQVCDPGPPPRCRFEVPSSPN